MNENYNYMTLTNRWFEVTTDFYRTYLKSVLMLQERALDVTRNYLSQAETIQSQGRGLVTEFATEVSRTQSLVQETVQRSIRNSNQALTEVSENTREALDDLSKRLDRNQTAAEGEPEIVIAQS